MSTVYFYVLDTLADWEAGYVLAELNSRRFFKKDAPQITVKTVSFTEEPIKTMGGLTIVPDCVVDDIAMNNESTLILPGANTWSDPKHRAVIEKAAKLLSIGATVCAICGATVALANERLLDNRPHTSNGAGFLEMMSPTYKGTNFFVDAPSVADNNLITASCTGGLLLARQIISRFGVFEEDTLEAWYNYFGTGKVEYFYALMQSLPTGK